MPNSEYGKMKNLIKRLFRKIEYLSFEETEPFFNGLGINLQSLGFPEIEKRQNIPTEAYNIRFSNLKAELIKEKNKIYTEIIGFYHTQAAASKKDRQGDWHPGTIYDYRFKIIDGKLNIKQK